MSGSTRRSGRDVITVVAFSISYDERALLARGLGLEHLRELLKRLGRPILRASASLAYGGHWKRSEDNFTFDLLELVSAEQADNTAGGPDTSKVIGRLYNHVAWPHYLDITPRIEATWVDACRIIRVSQERAGISAADVVEDPNETTERARFNKAVVLSAMRRIAMQGGVINTPDAPQEEVPAVHARIMLGGRADRYSGFMPGLFEEALVTLELGCPLYVLGGFGGVSQLLSEAMLGAGELPPALTEAGQRRSNPELPGLADLCGRFAMPAPIPSVGDAYRKLAQLILEVRANPEQRLRTGLSRAETVELMTTRDISSAVRLVRKGLYWQLSLPIWQA